MADLLTIVTGGNGPWREIAQARAWLEAEPRFFWWERSWPEWKWVNSSGERARLRYRAHYGFYWEFQRAPERETAP